MNHIRPENPFRHFAFGMVLLVFVALSWFSNSSVSDHVGLFLILMGFANALVFGFYFYLRKQSVNVSTRFVWLTALALHLVGLFGNPLFEDDYFRYLWDAYHAAHFGSPYGVPPSAYFDDASIPSSFQAILGQINYPDIPTIYGPVQQYSFLLAYWVSPGQVWPLQLLYGAADMLVIAVLLRMAKPNIVLLYAWSPLVFKEVLLTAHPDVVGVLLLVLAVYCYSQRYLMACMVLLAASIAAKVFAILLVPFLMVGTRLRHWCVFALALLLIYLPLYWGGQSDISGLMAMTKLWEFNSLIFGLLAYWLQPQYAKLLIGAVLVTVFGFYWLVYVARFQVAKGFPGAAPVLVRGDWLLGLFLLCAPVINPWYLIWVLPFAVIYPSYSVWAASVVVMLAYVTGLTLDSSYLGPYDQPLIARWLQGVVIAAACWLDYRRSCLNQS